MKEMKDKEKEKELKQKVEENGYKYIKYISAGSYGAVLEVKKGNWTYALKIVDKNNNFNSTRENVKEIRGPNLVKISLEKEKKNYYIYVMERSFIGSIDRINKYLYSNMLFKNPFEEYFGDNLMRFLAKQMVYGIRTFYQGNFVHFDIKPNNMLLFKDLEVKFIDFGFLKQFSPDKKDIIQGGTLGYFSPEYFNENRKGFDYDTLMKQDYFAIGSTIFMLKYGKPLVHRNFCRNCNVKDKHYFYCIMMDSIQRGINFIRSQPFQDNEFSQFLCNLIQYNPEDRLDFEKMIRNKWLNKNSEEIKNIQIINVCNEDNLLLELQKSDFLINNKKYFRKDFKEKNKINDKKYKYNKKGKFTFRKRVK